MSNSHKHCIIIGIDNRIIQIMSILVFRIGKLIQKTEQDLIIILYYQADKISMIIRLLFNMAEYHIINNSTRFQNFKQRSKFLDIPAYLNY